MMKTDRETNMRESSSVTRQPQAGREDAALLPPVDVVEDASGIVLTADVPGVPKDKLDIQVEADTLTIEGEMSLDVPEGMTPSHAEVGLARYRRVFSLSRELDPAKLTAELKKGVLRLQIPKAEHVRPRKIEIKVA
jgi:HSP20 family molecular chaperone IbpA